MNKKSIILLSGGLDSVVALDLSIKQGYDINLALTFDYNQKSVEEEIYASQKICELYNIEHKVITLSFLSEITNNALTDENNKNFHDLASVWVPNRNSLFINIAGCYCDKFDYKYIIYGANKEESKAFSDNDKDFINLSSKTLALSTLSKPKVHAPCANMNKIDLVNYMIDNQIPFYLIKSCYRGQKELNKKHCNDCMSCKLLYEAIKNSKKPELLKEIF